MKDTPAQLDRKEVLRIKLQAKTAEHKALDAEIEALHEAVNPDALTLQRLKRQKLALKDEIQRIEDEITPDIIA